MMRMIQWKTTFPTFPPLRSSIALYKKTTLGLEKGPHFAIPRGLAKDSRRCCYQPGHREFLQLSDSSFYLSHSLLDSSFYLSHSLSLYGSFSLSTYGSVRFKGTFNGIYGSVRFEGTFNGIYGSVRFEGTFYIPGGVCDCCSSNDRAHTSAGQYFTECS